MSHFFSTPKPKQMNNFAKFFLVFLFCFLLINSEIVQAKKEATEKKDLKKLCERKSETWTGFCLFSKNCDKNCKKKEKAEKGKCIHRRGFKYDCVCYFKC